MYGDNDSGQPQNWSYHQPNQNGWDQQQPNQQYNQNGQQNRPINNYDPNWEPSQPQPDQRHYRNQQNQQYEQSVYGTSNQQSAPQGQYYGNQYGPQQNPQQQQFREPPVHPVLQQAPTRSRRGRGASGITGNGNPWGIKLEKDMKPVWTSMVWSFVLWLIPSLIIAIRLRFVDFSIDQNIITEASGIFNRKTITVDLYRVQNISATNTFFGGGRLIFKQMGGDVVTLGPVKNVEKVLPKLRQITFQARHQQGVRTNEVMY